MTTANDADRGTVLLTGAGGYIAGVLAAKLRQAGWQVCGLDLQSGTRNGIEITAADITRPLPVEIFAGVDAVIHLAGKVHALAEVAADHDAYFAVNTEGTRNVLTAAGKAGVRRVVLLSTVKAMGEGNPEKMPIQPLDERSPCHPCEPYGASKLAAEELVLNSGLIPEGVVLRLAMVYGGSDAKGNLPKMADAVRRGRFPPLPEIGNKRSMVHVEDVTSAICLALEHPAAANQRFLVTDGNAYSTRQILDWMRASYNMSPITTTVPIWVLKILGVAGDLIGKLRGRRFIFDSDALHKLIGSAWYSSAKITQELGFTPQHDLPTTIQQEAQQYNSRS
ncbi:MAG: NAD-dependent epimerase/dehydratase family protein [Verrucomicrobia bacterium]|nr:NAD-dependent epimerase/dehydratase family protein [Verrucomicrobiota bacterium]